MALKHIAKMKNTGARVLVVFRTLPGESHMALVLPTATLPDAYHDAIMTLVESDQAQQAYEFGEEMFTARFPDGRVMLQSMTQDNRLVKVATDTVIMTPTPNADGISLDQLNALIAEQKNCTVDELCTFVKGYKDTKSAEVTEIATVTETPKSKVEPLKAKENAVLTDQDIARSYRSQADALYKEAASLRKQADELDPPKKKASSKTVEKESA